jgi:hypothetical protein
MQNIGLQRILNYTCAKFHNFATFDRVEKGIQNLQNPQ